MNLIKFHQTVKTDTFGCFVITILTCLVSVWCKVTSHIQVFSIKLHLWGKNYFKKKKISWKAQNSTSLLLRFCYTV